MTSELLPCPFCGGVAFEPDATWLKTVRCIDCSAQGPISAEDRRAAWNRRPQEAGDREQIAAALTGAVVFSESVGSPDPSKRLARVIIEFRGDDYLARSHRLYDALSQPRPEGEMREGSEPDYERAKIIYGPLSADYRITLLAERDATIEALVRERDEAKRQWFNYENAARDKFAELQRAEAERDALRTQLDQARAVVKELMEQWPEGSVPAGPLCARAAAVVGDAK